MHQTNYLFLVLFLLQISSCIAQSKQDKGSIYEYSSEVPPFLNRERTIRIYLPPGLDPAAEHPYVMYAMDGQNLFYDSTSYVGEWHLDENLDSLYSEGFPSLIIVGIDHANEKRIQEYNPYPHDQFGPGEGKEYSRWLVKELIPAVEAHLALHLGVKVSSDRRIIGGSSLGGLISLHTIHTYPNDFGAAMLFSISFPIAPQAIALAENIPPDKKLFLRTGAEEGEGMVSGLLKFCDALEKSSFPETHYSCSVVPEARHNEKFWEKQFIKFIEWLSYD